MKSEVKTIRIPRSETNFDKACDSAYEFAVAAFGIDEAGHPKDKKFSRSETSLKVKFVSYEHSGSMGGHEFCYEFVAWLETA